jgi:predicted nucleic acid-binding protein
LTSSAVLDASAAVNLVLNGEHAADLAAKLEETSLVMTPDLFCSEVANALWKYVRAKELALGVAIARLEECLGSPILSFQAERSFRRRWRPLHATSSACTT